MHFTTAAPIALSARLPKTSAQAIDCARKHTPPSDVAACADELTVRGSELCTVINGSTTTFCQTGDAEIVGVELDRQQGLGLHLHGKFELRCLREVHDKRALRLTNFCDGSVDIAIAVGRILGRCTTNIGGFDTDRVAGVTQANNNPDIYGGSTRLRHG